MPQVRKDILKLLYAKNMGHILEPDVLPDGRPYYGALLVNLAYQVGGWVVPTTAHCLSTWLTRWVGLPLMTVRPSREATGNTLNCWTFWYSADIAA